MPSFKIKKRWAALAAAVALAAAAFACLNTSTRLGRFLFYQDADWGDLYRLPYVDIPPAPRPAEPLPTAEPGNPEMEILNAFRVKNATLSEFAKSHDSTALIVVHDGKVLMEEYHQGVQRDSLQMSFSCTKSVLSLLVGAAVEDGVIESLDDPLSKYVPNLHASLQAVSIRHCMTMASGIHDEKAELFGGAMPAPWADKVRGYYDPNLRRLAATFQSTRPPGEQFEYHDFNPILVGMALENAANSPLREQLANRIWSPLGMQHAARWTVDSNTHRFEKTESGLNVRAIDFARLGAALVADEPLIVSKQWLAESTTPSPFAGPETRWEPLAKRWLESGRADASLAEHISSIRYGAYWWLVQRQGRTDFYANGRFGQFLYISPAAKLVIVRFGPSHGGLNDFRFGNTFFQLASRFVES